MNQLLKDAAKKLRLSAPEVFRQAIIQQEGEDIGGYDSDASEDNATAESKSAWLYRRFLDEGGLKLPRTIENYCLDVMVGRAKATVKANS
ncbi:MAG: hypothetical protein Q7S15_00965 [bacterium]|nr:hypothetical protein [bacterium]